MSELKYKEGDYVLIKNIDWYNENKNEDGDISCGEFNFVEDMKEFCSETLTISEDVGDGYLMLEDYHGYVWTDEMIERLVERNGKTYPYKIGDRVVLKGNNRCATITDLKYNSWGNLSYYIKIDNDKDISIDYPTDLLLPYDNMVEGLIEEETPKFKVNDIVFVKNIGWVRITNSYWDSLANEYIYEAIGFNGEGEYDSINQSNIECQMLPESENLHTGGNKITLDEYKNNDKEWLFNKLAMLDNITALESIQDIFNHLQQSKYPKTFLGCCDVLGIEDTISRGVKGYKSNLLDTFQKLLVCRDAYWKIAGEEMGLDKPWEPDDDTEIYNIYRINNAIYLGGVSWSGNCNILEFPTEEIRNTFYENFKELIETVKELL